MSRPRGRVLVVDDEDYVRDSLGEILASRGYDVSLVRSAADGLRHLASTPVDVVLTDLRMPDASGLDLIRSIRADFPDLPIVVLTGYGTIASAVECIRGGASDYILKPADPDTLEVTLDRAFRAGALRREVDYLRRERAIAPSGEGGPGEPVGDSPAWLDAVTKVKAAAATDAAVLLLGESGTGKELLARMIHRSSARSARPYVRVNCAAIPLDMWESEFFGHRKGAFTGAIADREGRFRVAHQGTLFMDEVGAMPLPAQAKMLRVLQDGEFDRLGDGQPTRVDVRVVAATNLDLETEVKEGRFRHDLFYRLDVVRIEVPPLRERDGDVALLAERFVAEIAARLGRAAPSIGESTRARLESYSWPGNVRELRNVIERALILEAGPSLELPDLPSVRQAGPAGVAPADLNLRAVLDHREKETVIEALRRSKGRRGEAARLMGIDPRNLSYYLRKHGIDPDERGG